MKLVFTFAIVGHNEEDTVGNVIQQACAAAKPGDRVLVVDSASTDATATSARRAGVEVLTGPIGKGAAMAVAVEAARTEWICFLDADLVDAENNIPGLLRAAATGEQVDQVVGDFECGLGVILSNTMGIYEPLVAALFPEIAGRLGSKPLTGFRAVRRGFLPPLLPAGYGVEAEINIHIALSGGRSVVTPIGLFTGKFKPHPMMGEEVADAVLDAAERHGRLAPSARPAWQAWVDGVIDVISTSRVEPERQRAYLDRLLAAARRPLPPTGALQHG